MMGDKKNDTSNDINRSLGDIAHDSELLQPNVQTAHVASSTIRNFFIVNYHVLFQSNILFPSTDCIYYTLNGLHILKIILIYEIELFCQNLFGLNGDSEVRLLHWLTRQLNMSLAP